MGNYYVVPPSDSPAYLCYGNNKTNIENVFQIATNSPSTIPSADLYTLSINNSFVDNSYSSWSALKLKSGQPWVWGKDITTFYKPNGLSATSVAYKGTIPVGTPLFTYLANSTSSYTRYFRIYRNYSGHNGIRVDNYYANSSGTYSTTTTYYLEDSSGKATTAIPTALVLTVVAAGGAGSGSGNTKGGGGGGGGAGASFLLDFHVSSPVTVTYFEVLITECGRTSADGISSVSNYKNLGRGGPQTAWSGSGSKGGSVAIYAVVGSTRYKLYTLEGGNGGSGTSGGSGGSVSSTSNTISGTSYAPSSLGATTLATIKGGNGGGGGSSTSSAGSGGSTSSTTYYTYSTASSFGFTIGGYSGGGNGGYKGGGGGGASILGSGLTGAGSGDATGWNGSGMGNGGGGAGAGYRGGSAGPVGIALTY